MSRNRIDLEVTAKSRAITGAMLGVSIVLVVVLFGAVGCASTPLLSSFAAADPNANSAAAATHSESQDTLPPKEAAEACFATAKELHSHGHANEAIVLYERARQLNPQERRVSRLLALLYDQQGNDTRALAEYRKALEIAPHDADLFNDFGYYFYRRRDWRQAEEQFRKAIAQSSENERAWVNLGLALGEQERFKESYEAFAKVLGPAAAHSNVGVILAAHQHNEEARIEFQQALAIQSDLPQPNAFLAHFEHEAP